MTPLSPGFLRSASCSLSVGLTLLLCARVASSQSNKRMLNTSVTVPDIGFVVEQSALKRYERLLTGDTRVAGTVRTTHNGSYALQSRLASATPDTIMGKTVDGTYLMLTTSTWVTLVTGPGGTNTANGVDFWVKWAKSSRKKPEDAEAIPVTYRVVVF